MSVQTSVLKGKWLWTKQWPARSPRTTPMHYPNGPPLQNHTVAISVRVRVVHGLGVSVLFIIKENECMLFSKILK